MEMAPYRDLEIANLVDISHCEPGRLGIELSLPGGATNTDRLDRFSDWFGRHGVEVPLGISLCPKCPAPRAAARHQDRRRGRCAQGRALAAFRAAVTADVSLVDRTSFECIRTLGISRAYALDTDFEAEGFELVSRLPARRIPSLSKAPYMSVWTPRREPS